MTFTTLGDEFSDEARDLTDAEYRTHVDALCWSNRRLLDLLIPKRDVRRFAETADPDAAISGLVAKGWWEDRGEAWYVGLVFPEWQQERADVERRQEAAAQRSRRWRKHRLGDHSLCDPARCKPVDNSQNGREPATSANANVTRDVTHGVTRDVTPLLPNPAHPIPTKGGMGMGRGAAGRANPPGPPARAVGEEDQAAADAGECPHGAPGGPDRCALCRHGLPAPGDNAEPPIARAARHALSTQHAEATDG
jgi:hypothetical protein